MSRSFISRALFVTMFLLFRVNARAWVYFEHRDIGVLAVRNLSDNDRGLLQRYWNEARRGYESRLTSSVIDTLQGLEPQQIDFAAWLAISGDHSCSPRDLLDAVLRSDWILEVADVSAELKEGIQKSKNNSQRVNYLHISDIRLQKVDPDYATRAGRNNVHFLLARSRVDTDVHQYLKACLQKGAAVNALGSYTWFHLNALAKAKRYAGGNLTAEQSSALLLAILADEAFALHFLEDAFAAGHIAGTWGSTSERKGTHDYYNEKGLEVVTWEGKRMVVMGDAYMRAEDAEVTAAAVSLSLQQVLDASQGKLSVAPDSYVDASTDQADTFNICHSNVNPERYTSSIFIAEVLKKTPVPGLADGAGSQPRFRSELGTFIGASAGVNGFAVFQGFGENQKQNGLVGGLEANFKYGFALDGVLDQAADGLVFLQVGWRLDGSSTNQFVESHGQLPSGSLTSAIPGRSALNLRLRMPYYLIPGDLMLAAPILLLVSPSTLTKMGVVAANGGLIPWQSAFATSVGRFQFILGREIGVAFYGISTPPDEVFVTDKNDNAVLVKYKSTKFDFPILEYRPFRTFSFDQTSSLIVQVTGGFDIPYGVTVITQADEVPKMKTIWHLGLRITFDWRHYL